MRLIILEKTIEVRDNIDDLNTVNLEENIDYIKNNEGVAIKGEIEIEGEYLHGSQIKYFNDYLKIDLLAPYDEIIDKENIISLKGALKRIDKRERSVLYSRYIYGKTQLEIAADLGVSQAQVSRIEKNAINDMRRLLK